MLKKRATVLGLLAILLLSLCVPVSAAGFTHWDLADGTKKAVYTRDIYKSNTVITARSLGLDTGIIIQDISCDEAGSLYILTDDGRILVVDEAYNLQRELTVRDADGATVDFSGARGIYVSDEDLIYIGDANNGQVLVCDSTGGLLQTIGQPESPVLPEDFTFVPTKMVHDSKGYLYVISDGAYYGALLFDDQYTFLGFYGANAVEATVLTTLQNLWDMLTKNDAKRSQEMKKLPYQFVDIALDSEDFIYTCTGITADSNDVGQIRMLSPGGTNILDKNYGASVVDSGSFNFAEFEVAVRRDKDVRQNFVGIGVDDMGFIYALDATYGFVYAYDADCNLIAAFGGGRGLGDRIGTHASACAIAVSNGRVLVADNQQNNITVYEQTEYGRLVLEAQTLTLDGEYIQAQPLWEAVLKADQNSNLAMRALAKAAYTEGDYKTAMNYAKKAVDRITYDQAMKKDQEEFISANFVWLFPVAVAVVAGLICLIVVSRKKEIVLIKNQGLRLAAGACIHPFRSFYDIKYKGRGSVPVAAALTVCYFVSAVVRAVYTDFRFTAFDAVTYNPIYQFLTTVGLIFLWAGANWAVSVLQQGKGRFQEVFIVTAYATLPLIVCNLLSTGISYFITSSNGVLMSGMHLLALILAGIVLVIGTMIVHEFSFPRFLFTAVLTLLAMLLIVFVIFMIGMLLSQLWQFIVTVIMEVTYR